MWKAETAIGSLQAIKVYPNRDMAEHRRHIAYLLEREGKPYWYIEGVLKVFKEVLETVSPHTPTGELFQAVYNNCVRQSKKDIDKGVEYPLIPQEVTL